MSRDQIPKAGRKTPDMMGHKSGKLTVTSPSHSNGNEFFWKCRCECGGEKSVSTGDLKKSHTKSCGCMKNKREFGKSTLRSIFRNYERSATKRDLEFSLTEAEFEAIIGRRCDYCGSEPSQIAHKIGAYGHIVYNGVDRRDNAKGYTADNVASCCGRCNFSKHQMSVEEFRSHVKKMYQHMFGIS